MAKLTAFEIHTYKNDAWKIESIFDDRERAVLEGERMGQSARFDEVRVVEETFDEESEKVGTRTLYRSPREPVNTVVAKEQPSPELLESMRLLRRNRTPPKKSVANQVVHRALMFGAITGIGLGLIYILNTIF